MSTIDTKLQNLNIYEGTLQQIVDANIGENDIAFATDVYFEDKFRYSIMPTASSDYLGQIVQYIGGTNNDYMQGAFYKCVSSSEHVEYVAGSGLSITIADSETFNDRLDTIASGEHKPVYYVNLSKNPQGSGNESVLIHYFDYNGNMLSTITTTSLYGLNSFMGLTYSGNFSGDAVVNVYRDYAPHWVLLESKYVQPTIEFSNIIGEPRDNTALDTELTNLENKIQAQSIQVTELPEISESIIGNIYQYIGDSTEQYKKGYFYTLVNTSVEYDAENSQNAEGMFAEIIDQPKMDNWLNTSLWDSYPTADYFTLKFSTGSWNRGSGYSASMFIDPELRESAYWFGNTSIYRDMIGLLVRGSPVQSTVAEEQTIMRFNLYKEDEYHWANISVQEPVDARLDVFRDVASLPTSLIEARSAIDPNKDGGNCVIIGSGANAYDTATYNTVILGANAWAGSNGVAVGYRAHAEMSTGTALGSETFAREGISIGYGAEVNSLGYYGARDRSIAIGYEAQIEHTSEGEYVESIQLGHGLNTNKNTFQVWNHTLLNNSDGTIPYARLSTSTPSNGYALVYDSTNDTMVWQDLTPVIPVTQETVMPAATNQSRVVQYIGPSNNTYIEGYFYKETFNPNDHVYYWRRIDTQPAGGNISYTDINNKPSINNVTLVGDLDPVSDLGFHAVSISGSYADLNTKPGINGHPLVSNTRSADLEIDYSDILNAPDPTSMLPTLPTDKDTYDYMLKWDHAQEKLLWIRSTDTHEDLGEL